MFGLKKRTKPPVDVNPFAGITILSAEYDPAYSDGTIFPPKHHSLADAMHFGESCNGMALGFTIGRTYIRLSEKMLAHEVAWDLMTLASEFGRNADTTLGSAMEKLEAFLWAAKERGEVSTVGVESPIEIAQALYSSVK